jgi:nucleotide-binding universal stress UspA family protein
LRVLVPLDGSAVSETVIVPAALTAAGLSAPGQTAMHLIRVMDALERVFMPERPGGTAQFGAEVRERALREGSAYLSAVVERLHAAVPRDLDVEVTWSVIASEEYAASGADVARAILDAAEAGELAGDGAAPGRCDLIAMATHGRGGLARWAMGSITERVLHAASLPMLIVRAHAAAPATPSP